ncbi:MAG: YezD family protein, partial [Sphingomonadaceae bacterium]|nr:YezD family protein [Sphingomonadaceae bacterium]
REALEHIRYGTITLTVHDARIVQLDITEKRRFPA